MSVPSARPPSQWSGRGLMALGLTILIPGLGQFAAGRTRRGMLWFLASSIAMCVIIAAAIWPAAVPAALIAFLIYLPIHWSGWIDAFIIGSRSTRPMLNRPRTRFLIGWLAMVFGMIGLPLLPVALLVRQTCCEGFVIPTPSMAPTLAVGDHFLVHKRIGIERWSVLAFHAPVAPNEIYAKRVVGLPGETVEVDGGTLMISGRPLSLPGEIGPLSPTPMTSLNAIPSHPITLKSDEYFVIGDNTQRSYDSRYWPKGAINHQPGAVPADSIVGVGTYIYWPPARWKKLY